MDRGHVQKGAGDPIARCRREMIRGGAQRGEIDDPHTHAGLFYDGRQIKQAKRRLRVRFDERWMRWVDEAQINHRSAFVLYALYQ